MQKSIIIFDILIVTVSWVNVYVFNSPILMKNDFIFILKVPFTTSNRQILGIGTYLGYTITKVGKENSYRSCSETIRCKNEDTNQTL